MENSAEVRRKVFIYDDTLKHEERRLCQQYVAELGGESNHSNTYVSEATHVVVHDTNNLRLMSPKVLGCLASGTIYSYFDILHFVKNI